MALNMITAFYWLVIMLMGTVDGFWKMRFQRPIGSARIDPIVDPGMVSGHVHTFFGGRNIGFNSTYETMKNSNCTSAAVKQDKSGYWTPTLMFQFTNGTVVTAEEMSFVSYYFLNWNGTDMVGFPSGFRMISGDPTRRTFNYPVPDPPRPWTGNDATQDALQSKAIGFNCIKTSGTPENSLGRHFLPDKAFLEQQCTGGLRLEVQFPQCWDGKSLDSSDHKSHVKYTDQVISGNCDVDGYQARLPGLFYELLYNVTAFVGYEGQYIISTGDPTGFSLHGDFLMGWDDQNLLQNATTTCLDPAGLIEDCPLFQIDETDADNCEMDIPTVIQEENPTGPRQGLPGNLQIISTGTASMPAPTPLSSYAAWNSADFKTPITTAPTASLSQTYSETYVPASTPVLTQCGTDGGMTSCAQIFAESTSGYSTTAPPPPMGTGAAPEVIGTSWSTEDTVVWQIVEEAVTVTVTAT